MVHVDATRKHVAVFCGSSECVPAVYSDAAQGLHTACSIIELSRALVQKNCSLVYGGGDRGLMGVVARTFVALDASVTGVVPLSMRATGGTQHGDPLFVTTMAERKKVLCDLSDVFVVLPGGLGTMDEMSEMLTWNQLGHIRKMVGILNTNGFYETWLGWLEQAVKDGFIHDIFLKFMIVDADPKTLVERLLAAEPPLVPAKHQTKT